MTESAYRRDRGLLSRRGFLGAAGVAVGGGLFLQTHCPAVSVLVTDLYCASIAQSFFDEQFGDLRGLVLWTKIDGFD